MKGFSRAFPLAAAAASAIACALDAPPKMNTAIPQTIVARGRLIADAKHLIDAGNVYVKPAYAQLMAVADSALTGPPYSVMQKKRTPPSGDKHDYMSLGPYWWPDTTKPDGLPFVRRDGVVNPETRTDHDGLRFLAMTDAVEALALAWYFTGEPRYATGAARFLRTWFIDPATRMNPHLRYAQGIPGISAGRGIGIIDLRHMPRLLDAIRILEPSDFLTKDESASLMRWAREYLQWLTESENGSQERAEPNNHGTLYDAQAAAIALFVGDTALARKILDSARARIRAHFASDGSQPHELERTRPLHYSLFNLDGFTQLAEMGRHVGVDLWTYRASEGGSIASALAFVAPYSDTARKWSKPDVSPVAPDVISISFRRASAALGDSSFQNSVARAARRPNARSREIFFYPGISVRAAAGGDSLANHALEYSKTVLRRTATTLDPANGFPRFTNPAGTWELRPYNQWTSGFFAGSLWYMYRLTREDEWRALAERWTAGVEPAKSIRTTHDLGFMVFDSFGHGYSLTRNPRYRSVVVEASTSLATRYHDRVGAVKSWDTEGGTDRRRDWKYPVIVDNLMNLEMLFVAADWGESRWRDLAERHALTSANAHLRSDGSTSHVALFNPETGALERTVTWQGSSDSSSWARGQAWAIHGFTTAFRHTRNAEILRAAERAADYFIAHLPPDAVPYWDLTHPDIPWTERDASAAAIAASGLLDLARVTSPPAALRYRESAQRILASLSASYLTEGTANAAILAHATGQRPQNLEVDTGIVYGDYYFVEALLRLKGIYWE